MQTNPKQWPQCSQMTCKYVAIYLHSWQRNPDYTLSGPHLLPEGLEKGLLRAVAKVQYAVVGHVKSGTAKGNKRGITFIVAKPCVLNRS